MAARARAIWKNGCQHISDGTLVIDGKQRPKGSQDESYTVTRQGTHGRKADPKLLRPDSIGIKPVAGGLARILPHGSSKASEG